MRVVLPGRIALTCPTCRETVHVAARQLNGRPHFNCPFCDQVYSLYDALAVKERRKIYHAIRDALEQMIYEKKRHEGDLKF